jgi:ATP-dependent Clp protease adaptor protein ClpS
MTRRKERSKVASKIVFPIKSIFSRQRAGAPAPRPRAAREPRKSGDDPGSGTALITRTRPQTRKPSMYRVLLLNDDYTTQEFVVIVLRKYFNKSAEEAIRIMLHVHNHGVGECGVYSYEVAETKVTQVMDFARKHQHPLQCIMEKN